MTSRLDERWTTETEAVAVELDGELVIWHAGCGVARLDRLGSIVWESLDGSTTLGEVIADLAASFGAPRDVVEADVVALLGRLAELGLAREVAAERTPSG